MVEVSPSRRQIVRVAPIPSTRARVRVAPAARKSTTAEIAVAERLSRLDALTAASKLNPLASVSPEAQATARRIISAAGDPERIKIYLLDDGGVRLMKQDGLLSVSLSIRGRDEIEHESFNGSTGMYSTGSVKHHAVAAHYLDQI